jgi:ABC-type glycerol-3-phosphate transport system permease component
MATITRTSGTSGPAAPATAATAAVAPRSRGRTLWLGVRPVLVQALLVLAGLSFLMPFLWMLSTSLKDDQHIFVYPPQWIPDPMVFANYLRAVRYIPYARYMTNTLEIAVVATVGTVASCSLVAYSLARLRWPGRDALFLVTLSTMMLPFAVTLIPLFIVFKHLGWINTFAPLTVPHYFGSAFFIFLLRQFFLTIPSDLSDAARIDGADEFAIFWRVILPLTRPALATVALLEFLGRYRDFMGPLIYLTDATKYTLSIGLTQYSSQHNTEWALLMAASVIMTAPIILLFFLTQKTFVEGITLGGVKG